MNRRLRLRILTKLAQTPAAAPTTPNAAAPADPGNPPSVPGELLSTLTNGYNNPTVQAITRLTNVLNAALHYASNGKGNIDKIRTNSFDMSGASPDAKHVASIAMSVFKTFLNSGKPFQAKVSPNQIQPWADAISGGSNFSSLTDTGSGSKLNSYLQGTSGVGNLKDAITKEATAIKNANPKTP